VNIFDDTNPRETRKIRIGVEIGQKKDPKAIAVAEIDRRHVLHRSDVTHFLVRHLSQLPPGTSYPKISQRVGEIADQVHERKRVSVTIFLNATGLGDPIASMVAEQLSEGRLRPVYLNHGDRLHDDFDKIVLGKAFLVTRLQALLQSGRIHLPEGNEAQALAQALQDYEISIDENANDRYGAFRVGPQDHLVTALGLAVHDDAKPTSGVIPML
jgi:hypothetical protein